MIKFRYRFQDGRYFQGFDEFGEKKYFGDTLYKFENAS
jgi:hypothetical protein